MNATERQTLAQSFTLFDEVMSALDERTSAILERRRRTAVIHGRGWLVRRMLLLADVVGLVGALFLAEWLSLFNTRKGVLDVRAEIAVFLASLPLWIIAAKLYRLYDADEERTDHSTADEFSRVFHLVTVWAWLFWVGSQLTRLAHPQMTKLLVFWATAICFVTIGRALARAFCRRRLAYVQNAIIVGAGEVGQLLAEKILRHPEYGLNLVGFVDSHPQERPEKLGHVAVLGGSERLPALIRLLDVERVIVAFATDPGDDTLGLIRALKNLDVQVDVVPRLFEVVGPGVGFHTVEGLTLFGLPTPRLSRSSLLLKRMADLVLSTAALVLLAPLLLLLAALIKLDSRGPVFFRQRRMGSGERVFRIWKLRTMVEDADSRKHEIAHLNRHAQNGGDGRMFKVPDDPRVTRIGRWLRRHSLDELPQLFNVVRGEMSLVGPRPLILDEDQFVEDWARRRLSLKPGCTGLWQILGSSAIPFDEMVRLDFMYVTSWSLQTDLQLMARTIPVLFRRGTVA